MGARSRAFAAALAILLLPAPPGALAGPSTLPPGFHDSLVVGDLDLPTGMAFLPDGRVLFVEQLTARIRLIVNGAISVVDPVCTVPEVETAPYSELGLVGIAVDPQWPARPYVYVNYNHDGTPQIHVARFTVTGDLDWVGDGSLTIDPASRYIVMNDILDNSPNHNGGTLRFGPDGKLYISLGDDNAPCSTQNITFLRGKILRIQVHTLPPGPGGPPAKATITPPDNPFPNHNNANARMMWGMGFRNPFRFSVDPVNGRLFIADVGEQAYEEMDLLQAGGGRNFGWPLFEGSLPYSSCAGVADTGMTAPIHGYSRGGGGGFAIIGGPVYRPPGCLTTSTPFPPEYSGDVFYSDFYQGYLRRIKESGGTWSIAPPVPGQPSASDWARGLDGVADYGVGCDGAIWYCRQMVGFEFPGEIRRITYVGTVEVPPSTERGVEFAAPWPSPARGQVHLAYRLPSAATVSLSLFDARGRRVRRLLFAASQDAGSHEESWDGRDDRGRPSPSGVYFARLEVNGSAQVRRFPFLP